MGHHVQAFADDVVMVFSGDTAQGIQREADAALAHVRAWGVRNKLNFAPHKTQAMVVTNKMKYDSPRLSMGGVSIGLSREIKILGLTVDDKLTFNTHATNVCQKALGIYKQLARAAKIHWGLGPEITRTIYTAVIEPVIMYAASAWAPATNKICVRKQLDAVQRGFAQKIIKAYRTVSLNSALLLAGLLPLDIRVREAASLYCIKKGYARQAVGDREIEKLIPYENTPHPAKMTELQFTCVADRAQLEEHNSEGLKIYTDGSKLEGKVGAAVSVWRNGTETKTKKLKLDHFCTVYQAELLALLEATTQALQSPIPNCSIYCDSRSALETVVNNVSLHPLAVQIRSNLNDLGTMGKITELFWIKAHAGLEGNERADVLAKEAALKLKTKPNYDRCPVSYAKRQIRLESLEEWNQRYHQGETASTTKIFFPDAIEANRIIKKIQLDHVLVQVLTGHGGFSEYLNRFKCKDNPACTCDPQKQKKLSHIYCSNAQPIQENDSTWNRVLDKT
ncbi:uncharacterized protein LOC134801375 [Cydia splendana]|uniref:uncharacterized protein LOC134801375 n=1 Tax=Cydia splendana TaxID=1100963 RepID=UPI00300D9AC0